MHLLKVSVEIAGSRVGVYMLHVRAMKLLVVTGTQYDAIAIVQAKIRTISHAVQMMADRVLRRSTHDAGVISATHSLTPSGLDSLQELSAANSIFKREVVPIHAIIGPGIGVSHLLGSFDSIATTGQRVAFPTGPTNRLSPDFYDRATITSGSHHGAITTVSRVHGASKTGDRQSADVLTDVLTVGRLALPAWLTKGVASACNCIVRCRTLGATLRANCGHNYVRLWGQCGHRNSDDLSIGRTPAKDRSVVVDCFARSDNVNAGLFEQNITHKLHLVAAQRLRFCRYCSTSVLHWVNRGCDCVVCAAE